ncbi:MAG: nucleoside deaminase, partial [Chloroflexota bacterium]
VRDDEIIAEAGELIPASSHDVTAHAEVLAVRAACEILQSSDLTGCTMVTTAEPCWMCAYAIRETGISRVVIGTPTPDVGAVSTRYRLLTDEITVWGAPPEVVMGVLEAECIALRG